MSFHAIPPLPMVSTRPTVRFFFFGRPSSVDIETFSIFRRLPAPPGPAPQFLASYPPSSFSGPRAFFCPIRIRSAQFGKHWHSSRNRPHFAFSFFSEPFFFFLRLFPLDDSFNCPDSVWSPLYSGPPRTLAYSLVCPGCSLQPSNFDVACLKGAQFPDLVPHVERLYAQCKGGWKAPP